MGKYNRAKLKCFKNNVNILIQCVMSKKIRKFVLVVVNFILLLIVYVGVYLYVENKNERLYNQAVNDFNSSFENGDIFVKSFVTPYSYDYTSVTDEEGPEGIRTYEVNVSSVDRKGESSYGWGLEIVKKRTKSLAEDVAKPLDVDRFLLFPTYINVRDTNTSPTGYVESDLMMFLRNYEGYTDGNPIVKLKSKIDNEYYHLTLMNLLDERDYERRVAEEFEHRGEYFRVLGAKTLYSTYSVQLRHEDVITDDLFSKTLMIFLLLFVVEFGVLWRLLKT